MIKIRVLLITLILFVSFIVACVNETDEEEATAFPTANPTRAVVTPLPTAVQPDSTAGGDWAVTFRYDFPEAYWQTGDHSYGFIINCSNIAYDFNTEWLLFRVTENVEALPFHVYLRLSGLSIEPYSPAYMPENRIHPDQETFAVVHLLGLSEEQAEAAQEDCEVIVGWDGAPPQALQPVDIFKP